jgi:hypothetical protein
VGFEVPYDAFLHPNILSKQINMSTNRASTANGAQPAPEKTYFEQQRELLVSEIAQVNPPPRISSYTPLHTAARSTKRKTDRASRASNSFSKT